MSKVYPVANYQPYRPSRNPYATRIREFAPGTYTQVMADERTEEQKGKWRAYFGKPESAFLQLELGAYHGETSIHLARTNPEGVQLGVEWKYKQCFVAGKKARDAGLKNVTFLRGNIARLPWMIAPGEVDRVWILFPDPWSKLSQQKWRVLQPGFFRMLANLMNEGKELMIKTDHPDYAAFIQESLAEAGCFDPLSEARARELWALIPPTPFERIFLRQNLPIHSFALGRNQQAVLPPEEVQHVLTRH
jgi:tRNA (guanine-N7-)-methyltransferase